MEMSFVWAQNEAGAQRLAASRRLRRPGEAAGELDGLDRLIPPVLPVTNGSRHPVENPSVMILLSCNWLQRSGVRGAWWDRLHVNEQKCRGIKKEESADSKLSKILNEILRC